MVSINSEKNSEKPEALKDYGNYSDDEKVSSNLIDTQSKKKISFDDSKKNVDFDDLLPYLGSFGKYQIILFLLMAPYTVFYVFVYFTQIFITLVPNDYWCNIPELQHLEPSDR